MIQRREKLGFALEAGEAIRVGCECIGQHLERDVAIQLAVAGSVDLAHAADTQRRENLKGA
jgi:hypothetical protein